MSSVLWVAVLATAIGTFLMRCLPLVWMRRRLRKLAESDRIDAMPQWLSILGPLMITAVLGVSLVPSDPESPLSWLATVIGAIATLLVWYRTRSLGWPVAAGVATYGAVIVVAGMGG
ncbi:AzlD domain-containing protein [Aidingimonas lacisalsi]|uniref:AzlD domain-containing protein n=1 Tax=Aidingimonas lacisalsi TaxID=2604086 RepID=UPI0011D1A4A7|nr:AzlD domain-containing protein [Aidingimonas lacisalsi]